MRKLIAFLKDEEGATAIEYGIMVAAIAAVIIAVVYSVGTRTNSFPYFWSMSDCTGRAAEFKVVDGISMGNDGGTFSLMLCSP